MFIPLDFRDLLVLGPVFPRDRKLKSRYHLNNHLRLNFVRMQRNQIFIIVYFGRCYKFGDDLLQD